MGATQREWETAYLELVDRVKILEALVEQLESENLDLHAAIQQGGTDQEIDNG